VKAEGRIPSGAVYGQGVRCVDGSIGGGSTRSPPVSGSVPVSDAPLAPRRSSSAAVPIEHVQ